MNEKSQDRVRIFSKNFYKTKFYLELIKFFRNKKNTKKILLGVFDTNMKIFKV